MDLSLRELEILYDTEFLKTKAKVSSKIFALLAETEKSLQDYVHHTHFEFPRQALDSGSKISRGEKYRGLPYMVLDFPRKFQQESIFAYRTIFLWGDGFSSTLHLAGEDLNAHRSTLLASVNSLRGKDFWICQGEDQWEHHFDAGNYVEIDRLNEKITRTLVLDQPFVKIARRLGIDHWRELPTFSTSTFDVLLKCLES